MDGTQTINICLEMRIDTPQEIKKIAQKVINAILDHHSDILTPEEKDKIAFLGMV